MALVGGTGAAQHARPERPTRSMTGPWVPATCSLHQTSAAVCAEAVELPPLLVEVLGAPLSWGAGQGQAMSSRQVAHSCVNSV